jgi:hypothetical protein
MYLKRCNTLHCQGSKVATGASLTAIPANTDLGNLLWSYSLFSGGTQCCAVVNTSLSCNMCLSYLLTDTGVFVLAFLQLGDMVWVDIGVTPGSLHLERNLRSLTKLCSGWIYCKGLQVEAATHLVVLIKMEVVHCMGNKLIQGGHRQHLLKRHHWERHRGGIALAHSECTLRLLINIMNCVCS